MCEKKPDYKKLILSVRLCDEIVKNEKGISECKIVLKVKGEEGEKKIEDCGPPCVESPFDAFIGVIVRSHCRTIDVFKKLPDFVLDCETKELIKDKIEFIKETIQKETMKLKTIIGLKEGEKASCVSDNSKPKDIAYLEDIKQSTLFKSLRGYFEETLEEKQQEMLVDDTKLDMDSITPEQPNLNLDTMNDQIPETKFNIMKHILIASSTAKNKVLSMKDVLLTFTVPDESSPYDVPTTQLNKDSESLISRLYSKFSSNK